MGKRNRNRRKKNNAIPNPPQGEESNSSQPSTATEKNCVQECNEFDQQETHDSQEPEPLVSDIQQESAESVKPIPDPGPDPESFDSEQQQEPSILEPVIEQDAVVSVNSAHDDYPYTEIQQLRHEIADALQQVLITQRLPNGKGNLICPFYETGCKYQFMNREEMQSHMRHCFFGVFQYCGSSTCYNAGRGDILRPLNVFAVHAVEVHRSPTVEYNLRVDEIDVMFPQHIWELSDGAYSLCVLCRMHFVVEDMVVGLMVGIIVQNIGLHFQRVIFAPIIYNVHTGEQLHHIIEVECTFVGRDGFGITPISYPGYNENYIQTSVLSRAFNNTTSFIEAAEYLDGVLSYSSQMLRDQAVSIQTDGGYFDALTLNLKLNHVFRCEVVRDETKFPLVPFASTWDDLELSPEIISYMDDGEYDRPSEISLAIIPQLQGQSDVMVECIHESQIYNSVLPAIYNFILQHRPRPRNPLKNVLAWILFPTVSLLRVFVNQWKQCASNLQIAIIIMESQFQEVKDQIKRFGCDIIMALPTALHDTIKYGGDMELRNILVQDVKYVFLPSHYKNCFPESRPKLQYLMDQINIEANGTIKIAETLCMHDKIVSHSRDLRLMDHKKETSAIFPNGWNLIKLGRNPSSVLNNLKILPLFYSNSTDRINQIINVINIHQQPMRWLVIGMNGKDGSNGTILGNIVANMDEEWQDPSRINYIPIEKEIMVNPCVLDPFLEREDSVMIGPYFILDCPQSLECDGMILLCKPIYDAEYINISQILNFERYEQKPLYVFTHSMKYN